MKKKLLLAAAAATVIGGLALTSTTVFAQGPAGSNGPMADMVERISTRFNLNQDEVQSFFDEMHEERQAERETEFADRLATLVSEGKLTEEQKQAVLNKHEEIQATFENEAGIMRDLSQEEREARMEERHAEMEAWAEENGIDLELVMFGPRDGSPEGRGMHGGRGFRADSE